MYSKDPNFNDYVYLTFRNNQYGTVGIGYVGTVCSSSVNYRSNLCEWLNNDMTAGHVRNILLEKTDLFYHGFMALVTCRDHILFILYILVNNKYCLLFVNWCSQK